MFAPGIAKYGTRGLDSPMEMLVPLIVAFCAVAAFYLLFPALFGKSDKRTREAITRLHSETEDQLGDDGSMKAALRSDALSENPCAQTQSSPKSPAPRDRNLALQQGRAIRVGLLSAGRCRAS
jgi:ABC-type transport system involved in cytochrome bd biosynthesis fused ATPase/permease subunit